MESTDGWEAVHVPVLDVPSDIEVTVSLWYVDVGRSVEAGEKIVELVFTGMILEVYAPCEGFLRRINRNAGRRVHSGDVLGWIEPN